MVKQLAEIELHHFRTHDHTVIKFDSTTGIRGLNGSGKTNIFRALRMVLFNKGFRDKDIKRGHKGGYVKITFTDGSSITRERSGATQTAVLIDANGHVEKYTTIRGLEPVIQQFTGFIETDDPLQIITASDQQYFLLDGTRAEVVLRKVSRMMAGTGIESAKKNLKSEAEAQKKLLAVKEGIRDTEQAVLDKLQRADWNSIVLDINELHRQLMVIERDQKQVEDLRNISKDIAKAKVAARRRNTVSKFSEQLQVLTEQATEIDNLDGQIMALTTYRGLIVGTKDVIREQRSALVNLNHQLEHETAKLVQVETCPTCGRPL